MSNDVYYWDCYVTSIGRKYFWARMAESNDKSKYPDEYEGRLPISLVTKRDRNVFSVGAYFTLKLGRKVSLKFSHKRWTKAMIEAIHKDADRLSRGMRVKELAV